MSSINKIRVNGSDYDIEDIENYSTTEQRIGTWIDGKPLYQITLEIIPSRDMTYIFDSPDHKYEVSVSNFVDNVDVCFLVETYDSTNKTTYPQLFITHHGYGVTVMEMGTLLRLIIGQARTKTDYDNHVIYFTIRYTKTTDTVNS